MTPWISLCENGGCLRMLRILNDPAFLVGVIRRRGEAFRFTPSAMVEMRGIEPLTSWMPFKRSPGWATPPYIESPFVRVYFKLYISVSFAKVLPHMTPWIPLCENGGCLRMLRILNDPAFLVGVIRRRGEAFRFTPSAMVEMRGIEPLTSYMRSTRSPSWATPPYWVTIRAGLFASTLVWIRSLCVKPLDNTSSIACASCLDWTDLSCAYMQNALLMVPYALF